MVPFTPGYAAAVGAPTPDELAEVAAVDSKVEEFRPAVEDDAVTVGDPCPTVKGVCVAEYTGPGYASYVLGLVVLRFLSAWRGMLFVDACEEGAIREVVRVVLLMFDEGGGDSVSSMTIISRGTPFL